MSGKKTIGAPFDPVAQILSEHLSSFDQQVCEAVLATVVTRDLEGPPIWLMVVAPPSCGKTVILEPLAGVRGGYLISSLTSKTLLSGSYGPNGSDPSLLRQLGPQPLLIIKDLGTLLSDFRSRSEIFAQFREVFDGSISKSFGNGLRRGWEGKATVIAATTPVVDSFSSLDAQLGERFLKIRFQGRQDPVKAARLALDSSGNEKRVRSMLHKAYVTAVKSATAHLRNVSLSDQTKDKIANLACLLAEVRTPVGRNQYKSDRIELPPVSEGPYRTLKMLYLFAQAQAALRGTVDLCDYSLLYRLTLDQMPEPRRSLFVEVAYGHFSNAPRAASELRTSVTEQYARQVLSDLEAIGVIESRQRETSETGRPPREYVLTKRTIRRLKDSGIDLRVLKEEYVGVELDD